MNYLLNIGRRSMIKKILLGTLFLLFAGATTADSDINVFSGEIRILQVGDIDRVAVGNGALLSTTLLDNGQLLLLAEQEGETTLHIWFSNGSERDYKVHILPRDANRIISELSVLLEDLRGIKIRKVGERIFLTGMVTPGEQPVLDTVLEAYDHVMNLTQVAAAPPQILPKHKMVYMDVKLTEFNTNRLSDLGIEWANPIAGPSAGVVGTAVRNPVFRAQAADPPGVSFGTNLLPLSTNLGFFGIATEITSRLNFLITTGDAVILAEPRLSARSGGEAEFLAGGEVPLPVTGALGQANVEFKEFGIGLSISPVVDHLNNVVAKVSTEVSAIDQSIAVDGIPGFLTRKTSTDVSMRDGQTLVMSGLVSRELGQDVRKLTWLGDIPILGALFRSTSWRNRETELVIFVTPTVHDPESETNLEGIAHRQELIDRYNERVTRQGFQILD